MNIKYRTACLVKVILILFLLAVAMTASTTVQEPMVHRFHSRIGGDWLAVARHNQPDDPDAWHPSYVNITSDYLPIVHKLPDGRYEIEFTSEIARELP